MKNKKRLDERKTLENYDFMTRKLKEYNLISKIKLIIYSAIPIFVVALLLMCFSLYNENNSLNISGDLEYKEISNLRDYQISEDLSDYKKTSDLTQEDLLDNFQKNYQESFADDGSYLLKTAEWTDKQNGEALITIKGVSNAELEETSALYVATMCYAHSLTEDILVKNIMTLIKFYDKVDFVAINTLYEKGIVETKTFTPESTEEEVRTYISETKAKGETYPHYIYSIPAAIERYLFGGIGDEYISEENMINDPTAIYISCDSFFLRNTGAEAWGLEYGTDKYFSFMNEKYSGRYFSMSQTCQMDANPYLTVRYSNQSTYDPKIINIIAGILNIENYGQGEEMLTEESLQKWINTTVESLNLPYADKKFAAQYSYSKNFEEAGVQVITNCTIQDTIKDCYEILDVEATGGSESMQTKVTGQNVLFYDENYVCGEEVIIRIKVKLRQDKIYIFNGFEDTNVGDATLNGSVSLNVKSPKLAPITSSYTVNYLEKGTNKVLKEKKTVDNVPINTKINTSSEVINFSEYNYVGADKNSLTIGTGENVINLFYELKDTEVLVHHYIEGTTNKVPSKSGGVVEDEIISGKIYDEYNTKESSNIANNYELVKDKIPENASGEMTLERIVVIYYYKLKDPSIDTSKITKESTINEINDVDDAIPYEIKYVANIDDYIGDAEITVVDKLPYQIILSESNIAGGKYDAKNKTITWVHKIENIDTFSGKNKQISFSKTIKLKFEDIDVLKTELINKVTGTIKLNTPEKTDTVEDEDTILVDFVMDLKVTKKWNDNGNIAKKRPEKVKMILTATLAKSVTEIGEEYTYELSSDNATLLDSNVWEYTFKDLPKYDNQGRRIIYTLREELDSKFYIEEDRPAATESNEHYTIVNTFKVPDEKTSVTVRKMWDDNGDKAEKRPEEVTLIINGLRRRHKYY